MIPQLHLTCWSPSLPVNIPYLFGLCSSLSCICQVPVTLPLPLPHTNLESRMCLPLHGDSAPAVGGSIASTHRSKDKSHGERHLPVWWVNTSPLVLKLIQVVYLTVVAEKILTNSPSNIKSSFWVILFPYVPSSHALGANIQVTSIWSWPSWETSIQLWEPQSNATLHPPLARGQLQTHLNFLETAGPEVSKKASEQIKCSSHHWYSILWILLWWSSIHKSLELISFHSTIITLSQSSFTLE